MNADETSRAADEQPPCLCRFGQNVRDCGGQCVGTVDDRELLV